MVASSIADVGGMIAALLLCRVSLFGCSGRFSGPA
jgi:hypothetical protein